MMLMAYTDDGRRYFSVAVLSVLAVLMAGVGAAAALLVARPRAQAEPPAPPEPAVACARAIAAADGALADARRLEEQLAAHTTAINNTLAGRATADEALNRGMPALIAATQQATRLDNSLELYRAAAAGCRGG